jgi:hypothetical protein
MNKLKKSHQTSLGRAAQQILQPFRAVFLSSGFVALRLQTVGGILTQRRLAGTQKSSATRATVFIETV